MAFKSNMLFDVLENILSKKSLVLYKKHVESEHWKDAAKFMVLRYLSMHSNAAVRDIVISNYLTLERMPEKVLYKWLVDKVPKQNVTFIKYLR